MIEQLGKWYAKQGGTVDFTEVLDALGPAHGPPPELIGKMLVAGADALAVQPVAEVKAEAKTKRKRAQKTVDKAGGEK